ncbi:MAG TPA: DUF4331 family protein [Kofleriaceae bacterium]|nr:DUF4331 family protein [Kofleriaceae bacterium]
MMKLTRTTTGALALLATLSLAAACGGDDGPTDMTPDAGMDPDPKPRVFRQVEHLARPGINEALLITDGFLQGYNATAPSFAGVDQATLGMVVGEAKTVLKALYLGACLLNGALGQTPDSGLKPAGIACHAVGPAIWVGGQLSGTVLTPQSQAAAQAYADAVFGLFIPDVMRVDTSITRSNYLNLCGTGGKQGLCGGRFLNDDTIDVTYNFLLAGAAITKGPFNQFRALVTDGVNFSLDDTQNSSNFVEPVPGNAQQGHPNVSQAFPYSAPPL